MTRFKNFGDVSISHGQDWIAPGDWHDFADVVSIHSGIDVGIADNQYRIEKGTVYLSPANWNAALDCCGVDTIGPPEFLQIAEAFYRYQGVDRYAVEFVQVGKTLDDWTACGTTMVEPDKVLHGNASIEKYLHDNYLD